MTGPAGMRARMTRMANDETLLRLARGGAAALIIKIAAAGLSFLMFLTLARAMSPADFGRFGFAFSLATVLAVLGSFGQRMLVLRFAPVYAEAEDHARLAGILRAGYVTVFIGCGLLGAGAAVSGLFWPAPESRTWLAAAGALTLALGWAEYQAHVLRAFGGMTLALAPRDIFWRLGVIAAASGAALGLTPLLDAASGLWITGGVLAAVTLTQAGFHPATRPAALLKRPAAYEAAEWRRASLGLWGASVVNFGTPYFSVVLLGLALSPSAVAAYFTALKIATLLGLALMASSLVAGPMLTRHFHAGRLDQARRIARLTVSASAAMTGALFIVIILFAAPLMGLFGDAFRAEAPLLIVLSAGYLVSALSGINVLMMEISGHERTYLKVIAVTNVATLAALIPAALWAGPLGAAATVSLGAVVWNIWLLMEGARTHRVATSLLGLGRMS
ncbi:MAG: lipopolysaccharide biosynthesis protein [Euryhalocaulis sp.]|uniref:lipopolysaccharide biosynthesis protein n=1 Tax=Euryhalocaulis sp. TaxID=2744307 RepID=UPI00184FB4B4|nr:lipopolysaccharide biosynthesis protein [Euryhalocaulis sp.]MBA4802331.1 lipopolysaccharide biosynthesis protein [Euryhalocaulis sp.]